MKFINRRFFFVVGIVIVACAIAYVLSIGTGGSRLQSAYESYADGEKALTVDSRKQNFNKALDLYLSLEADFHPSFGNGKFYYNIGNTYFQLGQYPLAVLYYHRAQALMPRDAKVNNNLNVALAKLSLPPAALAGVFAKVFFFHHYLSLPERLQLFAISCLLVTLFGSAQLWNTSSWFKRAFYASCVFMGVMLLSLGYSHYISPIEAVMIHSTELRRDAGMQYAKVSEEPIPAGSSVEVLDVTRDGSWVKIVSQSGELGYVPQENIRIE